MPSPNIQISIQGGGTKFATLQPAMDAALDAHHRGIVTIRRVAVDECNVIIYEETDPGNFNYDVELPGSVGWLIETGNEFYRTSPAVAIRAANRRVRRFENLNLAIHSKLQVCRKIEVSVPDFELAGNRMTTPPMLPSSLRAGS